MKVLNIRKEAIPAENYVYIGRSGKGANSKYGNPYVIGEDGNRYDVIVLFRRYAKRMLDEGKWDELEVIKDLNGKYLGCFCAPEPCHGEVLINLVKYLCQKHGIDFIDMTSVKAKEEIIPQSQKYQLGMGVRAFEKFAEMREPFQKGSGETPSVPFIKTNCRAEA